ncbi:Outer membrane beta-barrel assembly protein BamE [hydrothermal vent metagenome]|uniref:Outer membrane beta-barrel assembly protein BamE n=1 Tax=hydrothermal vent metagenome TaxID=652676 RepID=A0A3B0S028_9ZZZZ
MKTTTKTILLASALVFTASACTPITRSHGFVSAKGSPGDVETGIDNKTTVLTKFGNPSTTAIFEKDTWYYISELREQLGYLRPNVKSRTITSIKFDDTGLVETVDIYTAEDGHLVSLVGRETPTRGRELNVLEQLLGNVGRLPQGTVGSQNLPGGAGGPRRDQ